ncbi:MAG: rhodanese-related sulfurtransferase [Pseudomonadota bacterium]
MTLGGARQVATFYRFVAIDDPAGFRRELLNRGEALRLEGTVLLAREGLNATVAGTEASLRSFTNWLLADPRFHGMVIKWSTLPEGSRAFLRFKVKIKEEVVTLGQGAVAVDETQAERASPEQWHALLDDPTVRVIDVRNRYEVEAGTFRGAEDPQTTSFREFPEYIKESCGTDRQQTLAIFCTGGIRCEKAAAFLRQEGFARVVQLDGGILNYLEAVPEDDNRWQGECFVFDQRVTVDAELNPGGHVQCHACRRPVSVAGQRSAAYVAGVSCPACIGAKHDDERERYAERMRQVALADARGATHLGPQRQEPQDIQRQSKQPDG